jgi:glycosyltransferase involved in cell wall biosynthesis
MSWKFVENPDMNPSIYNAHYSRLLGIPLLGEVLYLLQIFGVQWSLLHSVWVSKKDKPLRRNLLNIVRLKSDFLFLTAWQLGPQLLELKGKYILSYSGEKIENLPLSKLYDLQSAVLYAKSVTTESLFWLKKLLPKNYPIWSMYIISVRESLSVQCDFIKQTIKELLHRDSAVLVFSHVPQDLKNLKEKKYFYLESSVPELLHRLPYFLREKCVLIWDKVVSLRVSQLANRLHSPVCWSFDPDDAATFQYCPKETYFIYDCVDYHTSLDPQFKKKIERDKKTVVKKSDIVFANSHTLVTQLKKIRSDIHLVPQGFDQQAFEQNSQIDHKNKEFFKILEKHSKKTSIVTFIGTLSWRIDFSLLLAVVQKSPKILFCLPSTVLEWKTEDQQKNWKKKIEKLKALPNVLWYPSLHRGEVQQLLSKTRIGIIPYDLSFDFNKYCFPMKLFEYLYEGIPVVSTPIHELKQYPEFVQLSAHSSEWTKILEKQLQKELTEAWKKKAREVCQQHSWRNKITQILDVLQQKLIQ